MYPIYQYQSFLSQPTQNIQYVNGKQSAEGYPMSPNSSAILMDSNTSRFYLKQTDASGMATVKTYDFKEAEEEKPVEYITRSEFETFKEKMKGENRNESTYDARERKQQYDATSDGRYDERRESN